MELRTFAACTVCVITAFAAASCAEGTGQALTPTLPSVDANAANADGTKLKASAPQPLSPQSSVRITNLTPQLTLRNGSGNFDSTVALTYIFEVFEISGSTQTLVVKSDPVAAGSPQTTWTIPANILKLNKTYAWRAYATYNGIQGSVSDGVSFRTPLPPPVDGPVACGSSAGAEIVKCVGRAYPAYLVATEKGTNSLERRKANMAFIRDRIIETGICKGLDLGRNYKRGGPEISFDFLVWRSNIGKNGRDRGVDLATGYDELKLPLRLKWDVQGESKNWGYPFYANYPRVDCSNLADPNAALLDQEQEQE